MSVVDRRPRGLVPVLLVTDRLRTRARLLTVVTLLVLPALLGTWSFAAVIGGQTSFAAAERTGVEVVRPAVQAMADTAAGRTPDLSALQAAVRAHPELGVDPALRDALAAQSSPDGPEAALAALVTKVGDSSKLILDPDLDSF